MVAANKCETCVHASQTCCMRLFPFFFKKKKYENEIKKKTVHIKRPEQTCSVNCLNMYSDDGPGLIILSFGSRNRIIESYYFIYTCTRFTIKKCVVLQHFYLILVANFTLIVGPRKTLAQIHVICNYNFLNFEVTAFVDQNKFE